MQELVPTPSPFRCRQAHDVVVVRDDDAYAATREALAQLDLSPASGAHVLLKPNAGRMAQSGSGCTTHPQVVAAAIDAFTEVGAEVAVGESPITGVKTMAAFASTGVADVANARRCPLIDLDARRFVDVDVPDGKAIHALRLCPEVLEYDLIVSIPVMKTHMHTGVTLAVKNMKGCLWRRSKVELHMLPPVPGYDDKPLDIAIADMASVLRPHLAIVDGIIGMEGLGPSAGSPKPLGTVVAGVDAFSADAVACGLMGIAPHTIPHLRIAAERGYGRIDLRGLHIHPLDWPRFADPFDLAPANPSIEFPDITVLDSQSCSACQSTLLMFLKRYGDELRTYYPAGTEIRIAIGKGHADDLPDDVLRVGNCARCPSSPCVAGCPPVSSAIRQFVEERHTGMVKPPRDGE